MAKRKQWIVRLGVLVLLLGMLLPLLPSGQAASLYTVKSTSSTTLAPGITQKIHTASYGDGTANVKYYVATADITRSDVMVLNGYKDNNPKYGACNSVTVDKQVIASETAHQNPNNPNYIENYHVVAACNGGFFNIPSISGIEGFKGAHIMEGVQYWEYDGRPFFAILKDGTAVVGAGTSDWNKYREHMQEAISGNVLLVKAGKNNTGNVDEDKAFVGQESGKLGTGRHPRTCVGVTQDGKVVMMVVDAQQSGSSSVRGGATLNEAAQMLIDAGCYYAINMDGGGSSTYLTKAEGATTPTLVNKPSDGSMRAICGSLLFASTAPQDYLSFDFDGTGAQDFMRTQYKKRNYDLANYWATGLAGSLTLKNYGVVMDNSAGTMTINLNDRDGNGHSTYFALGAKDGTYDEAEATTSNAISFNPANVEVFRVRVKFSGNTRYSTSNTPFFGMSYLSEDTRTWTAINIRADIPTDYYAGGSKEGQYVTLEVDLTNNAIRNCSKLVSLRFQIGYLLKGTATIDYMYLGPKSGDKLSFGFSEHGTNYNSYTDPAYGGVNFDKESGWFKGAELSSYDINHGVLTMTVDNSPSNLHNAYVETSLSSSKSVHPLFYTPKAGDVLVVRYKVESYDSATNTSLYGSSQKPTMTIYGYNDRQNIYKNPSVLNIDTSQTGYVVQQWTVPTEWTTYDMSKLRLTMRYFVNSTIKIDYIYVGPKSGAPVDNKLYIGFDNTAADRQRYQSVTYGGMNMDSAGSWSVGNEYNIPTVSGGAIKMTPTDTNTGYGYIHSGGGTGAYPLYYKPNADDYIQVRFKIDNGVASNKYADQTGVGRFAFFYGNKDIGLRNSYVRHDFQVADVSGKGWIIFTYKLKDMKTSGTNMTALSEVTSISPCFNWIIPAEGKTLSLYIDYIYIGPQSELPTPQYTVTFKNADGSTLATQVVYKGASASYTGKTPTKAADGTNHYTFKGWDKALTNITANTTITATYTATAHAWTYAKVDGTNHKCTCSCGYSKNEAHSFTYKATTNPTTSATGVLTGTCSKCSQTTTVTLPKLNTTDYTKTVTKAATCTETGTDTYKWKTTTYGSFSFTATTAAKGHTEVKDAAVAATCTTAGKTEGSHCSVCNAVIKAQTTVAATGHSYTYKATKNPTTSATGTLTGTCSKCSSTTTVTLPKLNTTDYTKTVTKAPTCTETGTDTYKWKTTTYGTFSFTATTAAKGHTEVKDAAVAATCTTAGKTEGSHCSVCNAVIKAQTTVAATGHSYTYKATKNPTTSATGTLTGTCSKCSGTTTVSLPKLNTTDYTKTVTKAATCTATGTDTYKWNTTTYGNFSFTATTNALGHSYTAKVTAPTCTAQGYTTHTCSRCSDSYKDTYTNATGHSYTYKATKNPTTSATGTLTGTCSKCSGTTTVTLPKLNTTDYTKTVTKAATCTETGTDTYKWKTTTYGTFSFTATTAATGHTEVKDAAVAATCTTAGKTEGSHCSVCNAIIKAQTTVAATGHSYTYKATKNPTTSATGTLTGTCSKCSGTTTVSLPKLNTTDYTKTVTKAATCTETGTDTYKWNTTTYGTFSFTASTAAKGHTEVKDAAVAATCTTAGKTEGSHCSVCNAVIKAQTTVAATGHSYTYKATKNPTTSATGTLTGTCSKCSGTTTVTLPKLNTTDYTKTVTKAPTCTETGTDTYKWKTTTYGSFSFTATTAAKGHTEVKDAAVAATCTTAGKTEGSHCSVCNAVIKAQTTVAATGHSYTYKATKNPTTSATGTLTGTCSKCSGTTTVTLPKLNTTDYTKTVTKAATCTETGTDTYKWNTTTYGSFSFTATTAATGHSYTYKATKNPTTSATGTLTGTCSKCSGTTTVTLPKLNTTDYTKTVTKAPTCTETGTDTYKWKTTTYGSFSFTATTAATGHSYTYKATKNPTTSATGTLTGTCSNCSGTTTITLPKLNTTDYTKTVTKAATCTETGTDTYKWNTTTYGTFSFTATTAATGHTEVKDAAVAATCTTAGKTEGSHCSVCNAVIKAQTTVAATGHSYTYKATKNPTTSATGTLTGTCSKCSGTTTVTLPKLNTTDYTKTVTKAATCTETGTDTYKWNTTTYGSFSFTATTAATGHSYTYKATKNPTTSATGTLTGTCSKCSGTTTVTLPKLNTTDYTKTVTKAATCTETGTDTYKWNTTTYGTFSFTATTAATGHSYTYKATKNPTTSATGTLTGTCSKCSGTTTVTLPKLNTTDYTKTVTKAATCTDTGTDTYKWNTTTYGSFSFTATTAAKGHTEVKDAAVAATCTTAGKTEGSHCSVCNAVIKAQTTVAATGHSYTYKATKNPTTSATGTLTGTCSKCSGTTTVTLPKLNTTDYTKTVTKAATCTATGTDTYKWKTTTYGSFSFTATTAALGHSYTAKVTTPTCTAQGYTIHTCSRCSDSYKDTYTNATGHSYTSKVTTAATCTKDGVKTFTCSKCSNTYTEAIAATGHTEVVDKAVAATCTTAGKKEGSHCSVCNAVIKTQTTVPATGHSYTSKVTTAATCTKDGVKTFTCSKCNHSYTEAIAATGHTEVIDKAVAATCTTAGKTEGSHCSVCNAVIKAQTTIPATGHSYTSKVTTAATCTKAGVKTFTCSKCSHSYTEAIAATGHTEVVDKAVAATCTTAGKTEGSHCSVCNAVIKAQTTVPATGHSYSYKSNGNGTHAVTCARCNDSYTENHNFGNGTCACGDVEITLDESIKILHTLDLASDISVTFAVAQSALANYDSYYLECVLPEYSGNTLVGTSTVEVQPVISGNYYYFTLTGITAVRMGDMVDAVLHMTKGTQKYISKTDSYSVATYAYGMLNSSKDVKMLTLCADLLRYGAEAQAFKGYRTDALVDADMTEVHRSYLSDTDDLTFTATDSYLGDLANPTITWVGKTLDLGSKVGMKFVFNAKNYSGDLSKLSMKVTYQGSTGETKTVTVTGIETYNAANKQYSFTFYGLLASELRTIVDVAIYEGDTQLSETLRYSAESYAAKTGTTALAALTKALFAYSDSAKSFFAK